MPAGTTNLVERQPDRWEALKRLGELRADGTLAEDEFQAQKRQVLGDDAPLGDFLATPQAQGRRLLPALAVCLALALFATIIWVGTYGLNPSLLAKIEEGRNTPNPEPVSVSRATVAVAPKEIVQAAAAPPTLPITSPSFDCRKVTSAVLRTICGNDQLIALDNQLTSVYRAALARVDASGDDTEHTILVADERAWIAKRQRCTDTQCIESAYNARLGQLEVTP